MRVYLDLCAVQRPLDDQSQARVRDESLAMINLLHRCDVDELALVSSDALVFEMSNIRDLPRRLFVVATLKRAVEHIEMTTAIRDLARDYVAQGLKQLDAIHLASAVLAGIEYFVTCDDRFLRKAVRLETGTTRVLSVIELNRELEP